MKTLLFFIPLLLSACAPTTQFPDVNKDLVEREANIQREVSLREDHKYFTRLQDVAAPVFLANAEICPENKVKPFYGFHAASLDMLKEEFRDAAQIVHGLQKQATIYHISPNTAAAGKLKEADIITQVDDLKIRSGRRGTRDLEKYLLDQDRLGKIVTLQLEREGAPLSIMLTPQPACGGIAILTAGTELNAYADGEAILFTKPMLDMTKTDNELALVVGHEIAHNSRKHVEAGQGNAIIGMVLGGVVTVATGVNVMGLGSDIGRSMFSQNFESEADYVGLYHTARAGYDIKDAPYLWRRMAAAYPASIDMVGATHPSSAQRFVALEETVKEIKTKQAKGLPLIPEERDLKELKPDQQDFNQ